MGIKPKAAFNKIVDRLSDRNYHDLIKEIGIVRQAIQDWTIIEESISNLKKGLASAPLDPNIFSDDY